jgi:hypothetical protein
MTRIVDIEGGLKRTVLGGEDISFVAQGSAIVGIAPPYGGISRSGRCGHAGTVSRTGRDKP